MAYFLISKRYSFRPHRFRSLASLHVPRFYHSLDGAQLSTELYSDLIVEERQFADTSKWRTINAKHLGINGSMIPSHAWTVLRILRVGGFEAYLVGGCVRDLLLNREPKDYDVITTAKLEQVKNEFHRCHIMGQRFPICRVLIKGLPVEVSSFETVGRHAEEKEKVLFSKMSNGFDEKDFIRWRDSMHRDFTINSLYYDPFKHKIYDYSNGMADLKTLELRTVIPAQLSFQEDCARILRGLRIAGRLGLSITKDTEAAMHELSSSVSSLGKFRTMMEMNYMLSYGAAESTISLLQRFGLLEKFLPFHTAYLDQQACEKSAPSCMMMKLFSNLDRLFSCDRPCTCTVWIALLAFHQALVINPQDGLVLWAFASILYHGEWRKGIIFARENAKAQVVPEISGCDRCKSDEELAKEVARLASLVQGSVAALIDGKSLSKYMSKYPAAPNSGFVFIPKRTGNKAVGLFDELVNDIESIENVRECFEINYHLLNSGDKHETKFALGKVVLETLREEVPKGLGVLKKQEVIQEEGYKLLKEEQKEVKEKEYMLLKEEQKDVEEMEYKVQKEVLATTEEKAYPLFAHFTKQLAMVKDGMLETLSKGVFEGQKVLKGEQDEKHNRKVKVKHLKLHDEKTADKAIVLENNSSNDFKIKHVDKKDHQPVPQEVARNKRRKLEKLWSMDSDVRKHRDLVKEIGRCSLLPVMKSKQNKLNEKKLVNIENYSKEHTSEVRENKPELLDMKKLPEEELNESLGNSSEIKLPSGVQHLPQLTVTGEGHLIVKSEKQQDWTKKLTNKVQKAKHKMHDKESLQKGATVTKDITKKEMTKLEDEKDLPSSSQEDVKIGIKKVRETMITKNGDQPAPSPGREERTSLQRGVQREY